MQNIIRARARRLHCVEIENVGLAKVDLRLDLSQVLPLAGGKVVDSANLLAALQ